MCKLLTNINLGRIIQRFIALFCYFSLGLRFFIIKRKKVQKSDKANLHCLGVVLHLCDRCMSFLDKYLLNYTYIFYAVFCMYIL